MSRWYRAYAGMMRDDKLVRVAIRSGQTIERVVWIWGAILESAAEIDDGGRYDVDAAEIAYFLRATEHDVESVLSALADAGRVASSAVVKWGDRQFQSDRSNARVAAHRERKRAEKANGNGVKSTSNAGVTLQGRHRNSPETETETDIPPKAPRKRGAGKHLLPDDWSLPPIAELTPKAKECAEQWPRGTYEREGEAFVCFWRSRNRMMADWRLTWANRVIDQHTKVMRDAKGQSWNVPSAKFSDVYREEQKKVAAQ